MLTLSNWRSKMAEVVKTITCDVKGLEARIVYDTDPQAPESDIVKIAYSSSRSCLGTENVSKQRLDEIRDGIRSGKYVGVPVWAYVHSGATISTGKPIRGDSKQRLRMNPFGCPWDSGQSGFAYMTHEDALREWGRKRLSKQQKERAEQFIDVVVDEFALYLQGECYGFEIVDTRGAEPEVLDSCWGFIGLESVEIEATAALKAIADAEPVQGELALEI
jgi:hypothetical protein